MRRLAVACLAVFALSSCATKAPHEAKPPRAASDAEPHRGRPDRGQPSEPNDPAPPASSRMRPADLPGWNDEDHLAALAAYQAGCVADRTPAGQTTCRKARQLSFPDRDAAKRFLEESFRAVPIGQTGLLTAYFSPQYEARERPEGAFTAPVRPKPLDLEVGQTYADRAAIDARPAANALAWMRPEDLFFLQIQGSGTLVYPDGRSVKAAFAAHNSRAFVGIANPMRDRGLLKADNTSGDAIRTWLADNAGARADEIMQLNPRYVFFNLATDDGRDPVGAAGIPLPPGHAVAVDPTFHAMGAFYWIDASAPILNGAFPAYRRAVVALDTGGAIKGEVRADLYLGRGEAAGSEAGRVRHTLRMYRLVPVEDAGR